MLFLFEELEAQGRNATCPRPHKCNIRQTCLSNRLKDHPSNSCGFPCACRWAEAAAARQPVGSPLPPVVRSEHPSPPAGAAARPTSGRCRALYPVSARPRLCRRHCSHYRDAVSVPLRVPGIQPLTLRFPEGTVRSGQARAGEKPAGGQRTAWGRG